MNLSSSLGMRILFLIACVVAGVFAGLWWTGVSPPLLSDIVTAPRDAVDNESAASRSSEISIIAGESASDADILSLKGADTLPAKPAEVNPAASPSEQSLRLASPQETYSYNAGIMRVAPAVVSVYASEASSNVNGLDSSQGSGVIVDADGIILTNLHLIDKFSVIDVVLNDGRTYPATLIGSDIETDLAVVQIEASMLPSVKLAGAAPLKVGDVVLAIGNPFGVGQTVTQGIVSATRRRIANGSVWQNFVQIDAAINPGNSGGALINPMGQLVGVNTAVFRGQSNAVGIGYAIPAELLAQVVPQIIENGSVSRGWLGLGVDDLNMFPALEGLADKGAVITSVQKDGPADKSGVQPMDVVIQLGEQPISSATQFLLAVSALPPGATVKLRVLRPEHGTSAREQFSDAPPQDLTFKVSLGTRPTVSEALVR